MKRVDVIGLLMSLQLLEFGAAKSTVAKSEEVARLRPLISEGILKYYDRYMDRGKKAVALVRHGVCTECHMQLSTGTNADLIRGEDITTCASCGRYLCEAKEELQPEPVAS